MKIIYHVVNVTSTEAELFAIKCAINQSICFNNISKIVIITDSIHMARKIFDSSSHPFQTMLATILSDLYDFFNRSNDNSIVLMLLEPLQIMLLLANIGLDSSQEKNLGVHAVIIRLNQDDIFSIIVSDLMATRI